MDFDQVPPLAAAYAGRTQTRRDVCAPLPVSGCGSVAVWVALARAMDCHVFYSAIWSRPDQTDGFLFSFF